MGFERFYFYSVSGDQGYNSIVMINPTSYLAARTVQATGVAYTYFADTMNNRYSGNIQKTNGISNRVYWKVGFALASG